MSTRETIADALRRTASIRLEPMSDGHIAQHNEAADIMDELVAALEEVAILGHGKCTIGKPLAVMVRAALAKARGE